MHPVAKAWLQAIILFAFVLLMRFFQSHAEWVENYYAGGIFKKIAQIQRLLTGWLSLSVGDVLYFIAGIWLLIKTIQLFRNKFSKLGFLKGLGIVVSRILLIYIIFNLLWGLNYYRQGISYQLNLKPDAYNTDDLRELIAYIIPKVNVARRSLGESENFFTPENVFKEARQAYLSANKKYTFLQYKNHSVKSSLYGKLGNYLGFLGYYNPFTGEAQLNVNPPSFILPFTTCHEIAHQLGYASEGEANFVGVLAAKESNEKIFQYSVYFELYAYANNALLMYDSVAAKKNFFLLDTLVQSDIKIYREFLELHKNPLEPVITRFYGSFLKANNQPKGISSYNDIVTWMVAYKKKYGDI